MPIQQILPKGISGDAIEKLDEMLSASGIVKRQTNTAESDKSRYEEDLEKTQGSI